MRFADPVLGKALVLSLSLHAILLAAGDLLILPSAPGAQQSPEQRLEVVLQANEIWEDQLPLMPPELAQQKEMRPPVPRMRETPARERPAVIASRGGFAFDAGTEPVEEATRRAEAQLARELLYPAEAIARGLEGRVMVLLFLDASGNPVAARVEASSGHALLDDAALRAARTLRALPKSVPREALLPVRFRLYERQ
ncbi:MAG: energy transducer TonB [Proteobacteria bacterium]|nr:energy transducer TonB [Pseudomonadota bacterium]